MKIIYPERLNQCMQWNDHAREDTVYIKNANMFWEFFNVQYTKVGRI
jgi:hypothetical protein